MSKLVQRIEEASSSVNLVDYNTSEQLLVANVEVVLGDARRNCQGVGVCRISAPGTGFKVLMSCRAINAVLVTNPNQDWLRLVIHKTLLSKEELERHFSIGYTSLHHLILLPKSISNLIGFRSFCYLLSGRYLVSKKGDSISVFLKFSGK